MEFPAETLLNSIRIALPAPEWQPVIKDWLNPDIPSSHERGWTDFIDRTKTPNTVVHQWLGQWQDSADNIVWYALRYDSKLGNGAAVLDRPDNSTLSVTGVWVPARTARAIKDATDGARSKGSR